MKDTLLTDELNRESYASKPGSKNSQPLFVFRSSTI